MRRPKKSRAALSPKAMGTSTGTSTDTSTGVVARLGRGKWDSPGPPRSGAAVPCGIGWNGGGEGRGRGGRRLEVWGRRVRVAAEACVAKTLAVVWRAQRPQRWRARRAGRRRPESGRHGRTEGSSTPFTMIAGPRRGVWSLRWPADGDRRLVHRAAGAQSRPARLSGSPKTAIIAGGTRQRRPFGPRRAPNATITHRCESPRHRARVQLLDAQRTRGSATTLASGRCAAFRTLSAP